MNGLNKIFLTGSFLSVLAMPISGAFAQDAVIAADTQEARVEAATQYESLVPVKQMVNDMISEMKKNPQIQLEPKDFEAIRKSYDFNDMRARLIETMAKHFTVAEIEALNSFYSKPEGRTVMSKMPAYMNDFMPYIQQQMMVGIQTIMAERMKKEQQAQ